MTRELFSAPFSVEDLVEIFPKFHRRVFAFYFLAFLLVVSIPTYAGTCRGIVLGAQSLEEQILDLEKEGVSVQIVNTLLTELRHEPERWKRIGQNLVDATRLTNLIEKNASKTYDSRIPLNQLSTTHTLTEPTDLVKLHARVAELRAYSPRVIFNSELDSSLLAKLLPSESPIIRVAKDHQGHFYVFDGNGRIQALRIAYGYKNPNLKIDVLVYQVDDNEIIKFIRESQRRRGGSNFKFIF